MLNSPCHICGSPVPELANNFNPEFNFRPETAELWQFAPAAQPSLATFPAGCIEIDGVEIGNNLE